MTRTTVNLNLQKEGKHDMQWQFSIPDEQYRGFKDELQALLDWYREQVEDEV